MTDIPTDFNQTESERYRFGLMLTPDVAVTIAGVIADVVNNTKKGDVKGFKIKYSSLDTVSLEIVLAN